MLSEDKRIEAKTYGSIDRQHLLLLKLDCGIHVHRETVVVSRVVLRYAQHSILLSSAMGIPRRNSNQIRGD